MDKERLNWFWFLLIGVIISFIQLQFGAFYPAGLIGDWLVKGIHPLSYFLFQCLLLFACCVLFKLAAKVNFNKLLYIALVVICVYVFYWPKLMSEAIDFTKTRRYINNSLEPKEPHYLNLILYLFSALLFILFAMANIPKIKKAFLKKGL